MNDRILFKACLTVALLGILILFIYSETIILKTKNISEITRKDLDKQIRVIGQVTKITDLPGILIFNIKDKTSQIKVIAFKEDPIKINKNDILEIEGRVTEYKGELEIQAEKIIKK